MPKQINRRVSKKKKKALFSISIPLALCFIGLAIFFVSQQQATGLAFWQIYQNLANPTIRYVKINEGMRQEEVVDRFAKTLGWSELQKQQLVASHKLALNGKSEGYYFPTTYVVPVKASPEQVSREIVSKFKSEVVDSQKKLREGVINTDTIIKIASIIQREAGGKSDMKLISGIIWNRLFQGMSLDIDATLQYAKGQDGKWWPVVKPEDKKINSPFNTYKNKGLPPAPISNPGEEAIKAALNPANTSALFYMHDAFGQIHTAKTYQQHVANIQTYY